MVIGGRSNIAGQSDDVNDGKCSAVLGGCENAAKGQGSVVGGGEGNVAAGRFSVVAGGVGNIAQKVGLPFPCILRRNGRSAWALTLKSSVIHGSSGLLDRLWRR